MTGMNPFAEVLAGDLWLLQPVSPRLNMVKVLRQLDLQLLGYLPPQYVDVPGRAVLVCRQWPDPRLSEDELDAELRDTKWINGYQKVTWTKDTPPLADAAFRLLATLDGGGFKHSSELPPFG
jgi:hypothetical protein